MVFPRGAYGSCSSKWVVKRADPLRADCHGSEATRRRLFLDSTAGFHDEVFR